MRSKTLEAQLGNLVFFQDFISRCAQEYGMAVERIQKVQVASEEALVNIFSHAYPEGETGAVTVTCSLENRTDFRIVFEDTGRPFDLLAREDPDTDLSLNQREIGGLGIYFIKQMMDSVSYCRKAGRNILSLSIHLV